MNAPTRKIAPTVADALAEIEPQLAKMRAPFLPTQISKLPKPYKKDSQKGNCKECGGYHGLPAVHLDYVGHAALTDRLLDVDPSWSWEPVAFGPDGLPQLDRNGGLWIRLTVCGVTRLGYGDADGKTGGNAIKEAIGDALRNAGMRFGAALDLWHKGDLHAAGEEKEQQPPEQVDQRRQPQQQGPRDDVVPDNRNGMFITEPQRDEIQQLAETARVSVRDICERYGIKNLLQLHADTFEPCVESLKITIEKRKKAAAPEPQSFETTLDDNVPY